MERIALKNIDGLNRIPVQNRIWELDFLRGIALILMIYFHIIYDLKEMYGVKVNYEGNVNALIGKVAVIMFLLISGICSSFCRNNLKRGLKVLAASLVVSIASYVYNPGLVIIFGILQLIGTSMIVSHFFKHINKYLLLVFGTLLLIAGNFTDSINLSHNYLLVFGLKSSSFVSFDYYPLIPWLGIFIFGMALGKELYSIRKSLVKKGPAFRLISTAGRHTLPIYFVHQPLIMLLLKVFSSIF
jgi:uncharacterized membrane protein